METLHVVLQVIPLHVMDVCVQNSITFRTGEKELTIRYAKIKIN